MTYRIDNAVPLSFSPKFSNDPSKAYGILAIISISLPISTYEVLLHQTTQSKLPTYL